MLATITELIGFVGGFLVLFVAVGRSDVTDAVLVLMR
jgi:hypothetical protein